MYVRPLINLGLVTTVLVLSGCYHGGPISVPAATAPTLTGDAAHPGVTRGWLDTRLYFGLGLIDQPDKGITEARWRKFLDEEVTPRFPDGLSVVDVYGQWQGKNQSSPALQAPCHRTP